jgi:hypothetical protein
MKLLNLLLVLFLSIVMVAGCSNRKQPASSDSSAVQGKASLVRALEAAGATVDSGEPVAQPFFTPEGQTLKVNGADLQVFEYGSAEEMEKEAEQVAPDGGSVGKSMMMWMDAPHFYKAGRIIVLYLGSDKAILDLLISVMGMQFAGQ